MSIKMGKENLKMGNELNKSWILEMRKRVFDFGFSFICRFICLVFIV